MFGLRKTWYKSILFKISALSWLMISFTLFLFVISIVPFQKEMAIDQMGHEANSIAASIRQATLNAIVMEDYSFAVDHCMKLVSESPSLKYVVITRHDGFSLVHSENGWKMKNMDGFWLENYQGITQNTLEESSNFSEVYHYSYPLKYSGIDWGYIHIGLSLKEYNLFVQNMNFRTIFIALLCAGLGLLASLFYGRNLSNPIRQLDQITQQIASGDRSAKAEINTGDELESLAHSFNKMTHALQDANDKLEARVKERTAALALLNKAMEAEIGYRISAEEAIKASLQEKEVLLKEIHHRVKNNLQIIQSLLYLQSKSIKDETVLEHFRDSQNRVKSMALIHEKLYRSDDFANINFSDYIRSLTGHLLQTYQTKTTNVNINLNIEDVCFTIDQGIPCGLIINELVSNSLKYAFPNGNTGEIDINLVSSNGHTEKLNKKYTLTIKDDGVGMPGDYDYAISSSLGLKLVHNLTSQLDGTISFESNKGTKFEICFGG